MDTFGIAHRVVAEDPDAPNHVYAGSCRLMGVFCASVGLTGLPTDPLPTPPPGDPVVAAFAPTEGADGIEITVTGTEFGEQGPNSKVLIGTVEATVTSWAVDSIVATAVQGVTPMSSPTVVTVVRDDGKRASDTGFTFLDAGTGDTLSAKGKKGRKRKSVTGEVIAEHAAEVTMPSFPSGAGIMLRNSLGTRILVGPFELEAGKLYPMPMEFPNGIEVVPSGVFDITLLLAPPL